MITAWRQRIRPPRLVLWGGRPGIDQQLGGQLPRKPLKERIMDEIRELDPLAFDGPSRRVIAGPRRPSSATQPDRRSDV